MTNEKKTARIDVWLPPQLRLTLELLAQQDRRKVSEYVRVVLEQHIEAVADKQASD